MTECLRNSFEYALHNGTYKSAYIKCRYKYFITGNPLFIRTLCLPMEQERCGAAAGVEVAAGVGAGTGDVDE